KFYSSVSTTFSKNSHSSIPKSLSITGSPGNSISNPITASTVFPGFISESPIFTKSGLYSTGYNTFDPSNDSTVSSLSCSAVIPSDIQGDIGSSVLLVYSSSMARTSVSYSPSICSTSLILYSYSPLSKYVSLSSLSSSSLLFSLFCISVVLVSSSS